MLVNAANITEKKYKKLTVQVSLSGMTFSAFDTLNNKVLSVDEVAFDDAKAEDIKYLRNKLINMIKLAENFHGRAMQKAIEAFEAGQATSTPDDAEDEPEEPQKPAKAAPKPKAKPTKAAEPDDEDDSDDDSNSPF